uniref:Uncharacterized protein n=1 Tax=Lotharella oceanica TaxID=641309 RepID=A0A7S2TKE0_9EUKA
MGISCSGDGSPVPEADETTFIHKSRESRSRMPESMRTKTKLVPQNRDGLNERRSRSTGQLHEEIHSNGHSQGRRRIFYGQHRRVSSDRQRTARTAMKFSPAFPQFALSHIKEKTLENVGENKYYEYSSNLSEVQPGACELN